MQLGQSESVSKAIAQLSTEAPGLVSSFFNIFPLVIVAGSVAMSEDKLAATKAGLIGLTPLV